MCRAKQPEYTPATTTAEQRAARIAKTRQPDNAAMYDQAASSAQMRGGGAARSTILTGMRGVTKSPTLASMFERAKTVLG